MSHARAITREEFRARLEDATRRTIRPVEGIFGPESVTWHLLRESLGMLGGGRAALLQTAHPWVAQGVSHHSKTLTDPVGRFHRTFENVFRIIFGSLDQVMAVSEQLHRIHGTVVGKIEAPTARFGEGSKYFANQVGAMLWVHATLWDTYVMMRELVLGPLDDHTKEAFYQEIKRFALCFGVPYDAQPETFADFQDYNRRMWDSDELGVGPAGMTIRNFLFKADLFPGSGLALDFVEIFTAETMPQRLREDFELPEATMRNRAIYRSGLAGIRATYPRLPDRLRYIPAYIEARDRIAGKAHSDAMTRRLNRFWVGREELVSRDAPL